VAVLFVRISPPDESRKVSITDVSFDWEYNAFGDYYYIEEIGMKVKNVGNTRIFGDLNIQGEIDGTTFWVGPWASSLDAGETKTISGYYAGTMMQPGQYTVTLKVVCGDEREVLGERTMVIQVP